MSRASKTGTASGWFIELIVSVVRALWTLFQENKLDREAMLGWLKNGAALTKTLHSALTDDRTFFFFGNPTDYRFLVSVDNTRTIEDAVRAGHYSEVCGAIDDQSFSAKKEDGAKTEKVEIKLIRLKLLTPESVDPNWPLPAEEILVSGIHDFGFRFATVRELLAFGETFPSLQMAFSIMTVVKDSQDKWHLAFLMGNLIDPLLETMFTGGHVVGWEERIFGTSPYDGREQDKEVLSSEDGYLAVVAIDQ